jgi:hypothetical protein
LGKSILRRVAGLWNSALWRAASLQGGRALQRIAALQRVGRLLRTVLLLILILLCLVLRVSRSSKPDERSGHNTLRPKCNFIHEGHLVPAGIPGISPVVFAPYLE